MKIEGSVPRIQPPSVEEFTGRYLLQHKPVVISGSISGWKAQSAWTIDYLRSKIGPNTVRVTEGHSNLHPDVYSGLKTRELELPFASYLDRISANDPGRNKVYLTGDEQLFLKDYTKMNPALAPLFDDFVPPEYCPRDRIHTIGFWLSAEGAVACLHYDGDGSHNLNVQVKGKKRVLLFSPAQNMYPFSGFGPTPSLKHFSQVNILDPDEARFPGFRSAACLEAILEEGDMLFIPSYWYHTLFHLGPININVNFWWQPEHRLLNKTSFREALMALAQAAASAKQPPGARPVSAESRVLLQRMEELISRQYRL
jgi:hypothetical protein